MSKVDFFSKDNILITADSESRKGKKGDGVNAILGLLQELRNVQDKVQAAADAQDITENKQAIEAVADSIDEHSEKLLDLVRGGIRSIRAKDPSTGIEGPEIGGGLQPSLPSAPTPIG